MAHADFILSITDVDLVAGMMRSLLALHQADGDGDCFACRDVSPCATVRIIASNQEAAVARVADPSVEAWEKFMKRPVMPRQDESHLDSTELRVYPMKTHNFKYPECPEFSGGICPHHHTRAFHPGAA